MFTDRRYVVTGVLNEESIAWHVAAALQRAGARVVLTSFGRVARITRKAAALLPEPADVLELDVTRDDHFVTLSGDLAERWGALDGVVHAIARGPVGVGFTEAASADVLAGFHVSAYSLQRLAGALAPLLAASPHGGSVVGVTVDSSRALPGYDWMGVFKASLESIGRYLALHLGPSGIRVNLVAAGPLETVSARGVPSFDALAGHYERWAPLGWDRAEPQRVVGPALFLLSDWARGTTGQVVHADGGMHAVAGGIGTAPHGGTPTPR